MQQLWCSKRCFEAAAMQHPRSSDALPASRCALGSYLSTLKFSLAAVPSLCSAALSNAAAACAAVMICMCKPMNARLISRPCSRPSVVQAVVHAVFLGFLDSGVSFRDPMKR